MRPRPTVVFESGLAGPPIAWAPVARLLDSSFRIVIHLRANSGPGSLPVLARELNAVLQTSEVPAPYLLVGHSFGALVIQQFAALYPARTAGLLMVDGLPSTTVLPAGLIRKALWGVRLAQFFASLGLMNLLLPCAQTHMTIAQWALAELQKLPESDRSVVRQEWSTPEFFRGAARILSALPRNLQLARDLKLPPTIPMLSLHSDYPDPRGRRVEQAGHWIQVDQPRVVAAAIRELASMA